MIILERNFNVGKFMDVDLELRTSEVNGILMSVAEPINGFPAFSLEISNGNVSFYENEFKIIGGYGFQSISHAN